MGVCAVTMFWSSNVRPEKNLRLDNLTCRHVRASTGIDRQRRLSELHRDADELMCARTWEVSGVKSACIHVTGRKVLGKQTHSHLTS